ncbi:hypothetical protein D3C72_1779230 [compost metagenome]
MQCHLVVLFQIGQLVGNLAQGGAGILAISGGAKQRLAGVDQRFLAGGGVGVSLRLTAQGQQQGEGKQTRAYGHPVLLVDLS